MSHKIVCFGETLWDIFPNDKRIGGAPLNVALRLHSLGNEVEIISRIGHDQDGQEIASYLQENQLNTESLQLDQLLPTGTVRVILNHTNTASYDISMPVAWDAISIKNKDLDKIKESDAFIFGSLSCRNDISKATLYRCLSFAKFKVFDANLRAPFYTLELILELMHLADFIKFNDEELDQITKHLNIHQKTIEDQIKYLAVKTKTKHICITLGANGALFFTNGYFYRNSGYSVIVKDTVGAGDSFLATLVHQFFEESKPQTSIDNACAMGAIVASRSGANPSVSKKDLIEIIDS
ncbi:MAG: carbohydrate kinase [Flavobacteriales bacterium]|nr:carbohydrate kinase [Flavobacteriales bacterium]